MKTRTIAIPSLLAALLALAGCAEATPHAASAADYPLLGFAAPAAGAAQPDVAPHFEEDRILPKPVVMTDKWAR